MLFKRFLLFYVLQSIGWLLYSQVGLLSHWDFELLVNGEFSDVGPLKNHGSGDGLSLTKGVKGNALYFSGDQPFANIGGATSEPDSMYRKLGKGSISLWFRVDTIPEFDGIAPLFYYGNSEACDFFDAANEGFIIEVGHSPVHYRSKRLYFTFWKNGCTLPSFCYDSNEPIIEGKWYHFVAVVGDFYNTGFLNGEEMTDRWYNFGDENDSQFFEDAPNPERMWLGKGHWDRTVQYLEGAIDELRIYNRPLSAKEISGLYADTNSTASHTGYQRKTGQGVRIFPNPAGEVVMYDLRTAGMDFRLLEIFDIYGKLILQKPVDALSGTLNTAHFKAGIYTLKFVGEQGIKQHHLIIAPKK